jgi:hypothetical protein
MVVTPVSIQTSGALVKINGRNALHRHFLPDENQVMDSMYSRFLRGRSDG